MFKKELIIFLTVIFLVTSVMGCTSPSMSETVTISITDMAGRTVEIPNDITKVYATGSIGTIFLYTLTPEKLTGWNNPLEETEKKYIKPEYHQLPALGTWRGTSTDGSIEELLKIHPDLIINMGDVSEKYRSDADEIQKQLGIPVIMVDGSLESLAESYLFLGKILHSEERAQQLADYSQETVDEIKNLKEGIPENNKLQVYYAAGPKGLETVPKGSLNTEILEFVGGINIADPGIEKDIRRMDVSLEQILKWNPDLIMISAERDSKHEVYNTILADSSWKGLKAVENKAVYEIPGVPFDWFNRPPSVMRLIGMKWLGNLLYPDTYQMEIEQEVKEFFTAFFDYDLSDEEIKEILARSKR